MNPIDIRGRIQIEAGLGRPLLADECASVASVDQLTGSHLAVVRQLAPRQLVTCIAYLLAVTASPAREILLFTRQFA